MKKTIITFITTMAVTGVTAQTLSKEITLEKDVVPEQRDARRLNVFPSVMAPTLTPTTLVPTERGVAAEIPTLIDRLEPAVTAIADSLDVTQRGYAALGYFPTFNLGASAGYRFIDNSKTRLGAWLQYDGCSFTRDDLKWHRHDATLAIDFAHAFSPKSTLTASAHYTFGSVNRPWDETLSAQSAHRFDLGVGYAGAVSNLLYNARVGVANTSFTQSDGGWLLDLDRTAELDFDIAAGAALKLGSTSRVGVNAVLDFSRYSHYNTYGFTPGQGFHTNPGAGSTTGVIKINPYWQSVILRTMRLELGVNADFSANSGTAFSLSPQCSIAWAPTGALNCIAVGIKATGGMRANPLGSLLDYTPYLASTLAYGNSRVPYDLQATITIGPFSGGYLELSGTLAKAKDWLMPVVVEQQNVWEATDISGWLVSAKIGYALSDIVELSATYSLTDNASGKGYYMWRDCAKQALSAALTVHPIKPLDINVGFESRWGRKTTAYTYEPLIYMGESQSQELSLGVARNFSAGALYRINSRWSAYVRCENIFGNAYQLIHGIPAQGIHGLVGATYRF